jgi:hypothetical protein
LRSSFIQSNINNTHISGQKSWQDEQDARDTERAFQRESNTPSNTTQDITAQGIDPQSQEFGLSNQDQYGLQDQFGDLDDQDPYSNLEDEDQESTSAGEDPNPDSLYGPEEPLA